MNKEGGFCRFAMQKQNEITKQTKLLNDDGTLNEIGWCRHNLFEYNREAISAPKSRIKEWDFYQVGSREGMVQINFFNISLASAATVTYVNFKTGEVVKDVILYLGTINRFPVNRNGEQPYSFEHRDKKNKKYMLLENCGDKRRLYFKSDIIEADFTLQNNPQNESITIVTPFKNKTRFFLTNKINCMPAEGFVKFSDKTVEFKGEEVFGVLDWGRGPWQHKNFWFWGNGSKWIDGKLFGFEITWGIGIEDNATETALFYDGKCHKLGKVDVEYQPDGRWMEPWKFHEENGRFELTMTPFYDNKDGIIVGCVGMKTHQVHGIWNGTVTLDDGTVLEIKDMYAFCEKVYNKW